MNNIFQERSFHLISRPTTRWRLTYTQEHGPFEGIAYFPAPPNDPGQRILRSEVYAEGAQGRIDSTRSLDAGPLKKPLFKLILKELGTFRIVVRFDVQFYETALVKGQSTTPVPALSSTERTEYLKDGWPSSEAREWFRTWMKQNNLIRSREMSEVDFAYDALVFMQEKFTYKIPDGVVEWKAMVKQDPVMGNWRYTLSTWSGECWRISETYCRILRMNGIPARLVSGNHVGQGSGHHLRSLAYFSTIGWVPVEATSAVSSQQKPPTPFMGNWGGTMLSGNENIDYVLEGPRGKGGIGTLDFLVLYPKAGSWEFPSLKFVSERL